MTFGKHQSFYLRKNWIQKGIKGIQEDSRVFVSSNYFLLGIGISMTKSLRYWLEGLKLIEEIDKEHHRTIFLEFLLLNDQSLKLDVTKKLLYTNLVTNFTDFPAFYWYANVLDNDSNGYTKEMLVEKYIEWIVLDLKRKVSLDTLKRDIDCLVSTYTMIKGEDPEDVIYSEFSDIKYMIKEDDIFKKRAFKHNEINHNLVLYMILKNENEHISITLDNLLFNPMLPGKIFCISKYDMVKILNSLEKKYEGRIVFTRTNNLNSLEITGITVQEVLERMYV